MISMPVMKKNSPLKRKKGHHSMNNHIVNEIMKPIAHTTLLLMTFPLELDGALLPYRKDSGPLPRVACILPSILASARMCPKYESRRLVFAFDEFRLLDL
jgi:hypothetical protein